MSLLSVSPEQYGDKLNFLDAIGFGSQMLLIGMLAVFAVLGLLWAVLTVFKMVFENKGASPAKTKPEPVPVVSEVKASGDDQVIVAVIAAAIAMAESESEEGLKFRVVSFRRK